MFKIVNLQNLSGFSVGIRIVVSVLLAVGATACKECADDNAKMFVINEDDSKFYTLPSEKMNETGALEYIDNFKGSKITHFFMCPNAQRAAFRSKTRQAIWDEPACGKGFENSFAYPPFKSNRIWAHNAKLCHDNGTDIYKIWIKRCREIGISPWISMRMNDMHCPNHEQYLGHGKFWLEHPEFRRNFQAIKNKAWDHFALNYKYKEVRDYQLAFVRELFERYDFDGIELDWMRFSLHLSPNNGENEAELLTDFMRDVKKIALEFGKKRGRNIKIAVRVNNTADGSKYVGFDVPKWAMEKLVDIVVSSPVWFADYDISARDWKIALGEGSKNVKVIVATEHGTAGLFGLPRVPLDVPMLCGFTENALFDGADGTYFFNLIYLKKEMKELVALGVDEKTVRNVPRRHTVSFHDFREPRTPDDIKAQLPRRIDTDCEFSVQCGHLPDKLSSTKVSVVLAFDRCDAAPRCEVSLNGAKSVLVEHVVDTKRFGGGKAAVRYIFSSNAAKEGVNKIAVAKPAKPPKGRIIWAELDFGI